jgi:hypothetical protein
MEGLWRLAVDTIGPKVHDYCEKIASLKEDRVRLILQFLDVDPYSSFCLNSFLFRSDLAILTRTRSSSSQQMAYT